MTHSPDCPRYNHNPDNPACTCKGDEISIDDALDEMAVELRKPDENGLVMEGFAELLDEAAVKLRTLDCAVAELLEVCENEYGTPDDDTLPVYAAMRRAMGARL